MKKKRTRLLAIAFGMALPCALPQSLHAATTRDLDEDSIINSAYPDIDNDVIPN